MSRFRDRVCEMVDEAMEQAGGFYDETNAHDCEMLAAIVDDIVCNFGLYYTAYKEGA